MPTVKLSQGFINNDLHCSKGKIEYCDIDLPGLYIEVRATSPGQGTYYLRYKDTNNKTCHQKIGRSSDVSLANARKKARTLKALGAEPSRKTTLTYSNFFENHYLPYVKPRKRSWETDNNFYRLRLKEVFGCMYLNQITRHQIQVFHTELKDEGLAAATCNHYIKLLKHSLNLAIDWELLDVNPAVRVPLFHEDNKGCRSHKNPGIIAILRNHSCQQR